MRTGPVVDRMIAALIPLLAVAIVWTATHISWTLAKPPAGTPTAQRK